MDFRLSSFLSALRLGKPPDQKIIKNDGAQENSFHTSIVKIPFITIGTHPYMVRHEPIPPTPGPLFDLPWSKILASAYKPRPVQGETQHPTLPLKRTHFIVNCEVFMVQK